MAQAETVTAPDRLLELVPRLEAAEGFAEVVASLQAGHGATLDGVRGSSCARVAATLLPHAPALLVTSIPAVLEGVLSPELRSGQARRLARGDTVDVEKLAKWLVDQGFESTSVVELPGEFSSRGGILDLFAPDWFDPVRVEFFGD